MRTRLTLLFACLLFGMNARSDAGLQSALSLALPDLQLARYTPTIYIGFDEPYAPLPADLLFVDPVASTLGNAVYGDGPRYTYNPVSGGVDLLAPPLLGPADEFGQRPIYFPSHIEIFADSWFASPSLPVVSRYERNPISSSDPGPSFPDPAPGDPSFFLDTPATGFGVSVNAKSLSVDRLSRRGFNGVAVSFPQLLESELPESLFGTAGWEDWSSQMWISYLMDHPSLPEIRLAVDYSLAYTTSSTQHAPLSFRMYAAPDANAYSAPEPSSLLCVAGLLTGMIIPRRRR